MSSISGVSSNNNLYATPSQNSSSQAAQAFQAIGSALQSGNLSTAQTALASFQQALTGSSSSSSNSSSSSSSSSNQPFGGNSQANTSFQSLVSALQAGNLSGAQSAYSSVQDGLKSSTQPSAQTHRGHHHHGAGTATNASSAAAATAGLSYTAGDEDSEDGSLNATA